MRKLLTGHRPNEERSSRLISDHVPGALTLTQIAKTLDIAPHWIYDRIHNGTVQIPKDAKTGLYLFPDEPATLEGFKQLVQGTVKKLRF